MLVALTLALALGQESARPSFAEWLAGVRAEAIARGLREEVVDAALRGLKKGKATVLSGWANYLGAILGKHVPDSVSTRVMARALRPKYQENE